MVDVTVEVDVEEIKRKLGTLSDQTGKVIARAVNRAYPTGKTAIARETRKRYAITQKEINSEKTLKITKATASKPVAVLDYKDSHWNLYLWNSKKAVTPDIVIHWSHGVPNVTMYKAAVKRGPKHPLDGDRKPFIQKVRKGERAEFTGLFRRQTSKRDAKLVGVSAPAIPQIIKNDEVMAQFSRAAGPMLQKRLEHEIDAVLRGVVK